MLIHGLAYACRVPKTLDTSFKYKIVVGGLQTLTKRVLSSENTSQDFPMAEFTPLAILAWIKKLGPSFKDALFAMADFTPLAVFFVLLLNFGSQLSMFSNSMVWNYAPLLKNLVQSWAN